MNVTDPREIAATFARAAGFDVDVMSLHAGAFAFAAAGAVVTMRGIKHTLGGFQDGNGRTMVDPDGDVWTCEVTLVCQESGAWLPESVAALSGFCVD